MNKNTCSRKWKDGSHHWKCIAEATEIVNGKHLCHKHAQNTRKRMRAKERMKNGTYGIKNSGQSITDS